MRCILLLMPLLMGCVSQRGIPNFSRVEGNLYRGGQPDVYGWNTLHSLGITTVIKLNVGRDAYAEAMGMRVVYLPITTGQQFAGRPSEAAVGLAVRKINQCLSEGKPVYVHCTHGQDRTGLVIGKWRLSQGWTKRDAFKEMRALGFHPLPGLCDAWEGNE